VCDKEVGATPGAVIPGTSDIKALRPGAVAAVFMAGVMLRHTSKAHLHLERGEKFPGYPSGGSI